MWYKLKSTKLWMCASVLLIATGLCLGKFLTGSEWVTVAGLVIGVYAGSNVLMKDKAAPPQDGSGGQPSE